MFLLEKIHFLYSNLRMEIFLNEGQHLGHAKGQVSAHKVSRPSGSWSQSSPPENDFIHV